MMNTTTAVRYVDHALRSEGDVTVTAASEDFSGTRTILVRTLPFHRIFLVISIRQDVVIVNHPPIDNVYLSEWSLPTTLSKYVKAACYNIVTV
eukprot:scaffold5693_cov141-Skeletonema_menzelii.AAC.28